MAPLAAATSAPATFTLPGFAVLGPCSGSNARTSNLERANLERANVEPRTRT
jgi:hypothetical protein